MVCFTSMKEGFFLVPTCRPDDFSGTAAGGGSCASGGMGAGGAGATFVACVPGNNSAASDGVGGTSGGAGGAVDSTVSTTGGGAGAVETGVPGNALFMGSAGTSGTSLAVGFSAA